MRNVKLLVAIFAAIVVCAIGVQRAQAEEFAPANPDSTTKWETTPIIVDTTSRKLRLMGSSPIIADISKWQGDINWAKASKKLDLAIIRTQHGSTEEDTYHKKNETEAKKYGVPFGVYAFSLAESSSDAKTEANNFYNRADKNALFYVIDVEKNTSTSGESMRTITNAYMKQLRTKTDKKIGLYIAHHLYKSFNLDTTKADFVWIPRYSTTKPDFSYDLWQYTDKGRIDGINTNVDLNRLNPNLTLNQFLANVTSTNDQYTVDPDQHFNEGQSNDNASETEPASVHIEYHTSNPKHIILSSNTNQYSSSSLSESTKTNTLKKGQVFETVDLIKNTQGKMVLKLANGQYITADKRVAIKCIANMASYYTVKPSFIILKTTVGAYSSTTFNNSTMLGKVKKNTILTVRDIEYTSTGVPRFKTVSGSYVTANKSYVNALTTKYKNYVVTKPSYVKLKKSIYQYSNISLTKSAKGPLLLKGKVLNIKGITYTSGGTPRLQLTNGRFITANKSYLIAY